MDKTKSDRTKAPKTGTDIQAAPDPKRTRSGRIWIREDGAICIENECVVIESRKDGTLDYTVNPNRCSCEAEDDAEAIGDQLYQAILKSALSGKGANIVIKPKED